MNRLVLSAALLCAVAAVAASDPEPCPACLEPENAGLCHSDKCQRQVLPVLRESSLKKDAGRGYYAEPLPPRTEKLATEHADRMAQQSKKSLVRIGRALDGEWTKTRRPRRQHR